MSSSNRRRVAAGALASFALAAGLGVAVKGTASAAEASHLLTVQRVLNDEADQLVASVEVNDFDSDDKFCVNLLVARARGPTPPHKVYEGHGYQVIGRDGADCKGRGYGQTGGDKAIVPNGLETAKYWLTPNFR